MNLVAKVIVWIVLSLFAALGAKAEDVSPPQDVQAARLVICDTAAKAQVTSDVLASSDLIRFNVVGGPAAARFSGQLLWSRSRG